MRLAWKIMLACASSDFNLHLGEVHAVSQLRNVSTRSHAPSMSWCSSIQGKTFCVAMHGECAPSAQSECSLLGSHLHRFTQFTLSANGRCQLWPQWTLWQSVWVTEGVSQCRTCVGVTQYLLEITRSGYSRTLRRKVHSWTASIT